MDSSAVAFQAEELIRASYLDTGAVLYWPEQFESRLGVSEATALEALRRLVDARKLEVVVQIMSETNHPCWEGSPAELEAEDLRGCCEECGHPLEDFRERLFVHFVMTPDWRDAINATKKKRPMTPLLLPFRPVCLDT